MEQDGTWGDHVILCAAANCYETCIHVVSSLPNGNDVIIRPHCPVDKSKPLVLGHVHEVHYVSLQPIQGKCTCKLHVAVPFPPHPSGNLLVFCWREGSAIHILINVLFQNISFCNKITIKSLIPDTCVPT